MLSEERLAEAKARMFAIERALLDADIPPDKVTGASLLVLACTLAVNGGVSREALIHAVEKSYDLVAFKAATGL